ncbi:MAG: TolC family protein, partial [Acidobacteria bacterium]|nr:TolC family protein [Acidobacteriota bacterium]
PQLILEELVAEALQNNPEIRAARQRFDAALKRPSQMSTLPDPTVTFGYTNLGNPLPLTSIGEQEMSRAGLSFSQEIPFPGKLGLKGNVAGKDAEIRGEEYRSTELKVISSLKVAYFDLYFVDRSIEVIEKNNELLEKFLRIAEEKYRVGKGIQQDVLKAQVEISLLLERLAVLRQKRETLSAFINSLLNRRPDTPLGSPGPVRTSEFSRSLEQLYALAEENSPQLRAAALAVDRDALALDLAKKEYLPDFMLKGGYASRGQFSDMWEAEIGLKIPLYFWRKQRLGVEEAVAGLQSAKSGYRAAIQELFYQIRDQYVVAQTARQLVDLYGSGILPQATLSLESAMAGYQVGSVDFLTLLNNFIVLLNYEVQYYQQVTDHEKALARLEELATAKLMP